MADAMVKSGMKDAGYQYVVIDDCWQVLRDAHGDIVADPHRFPRGIKAVADYVHSLGLKFGIYSDAGAKTCQGRPGGLGHEYQDGLMYAAWGVDYLKYDWCTTLPGQDARASYANIRQALDASGRPIVLSICERGKREPWLWGAEVGGNLWCTTDDIQDRWSGKENWPGGGCCPNGVMSILDELASLHSYAGPGHWNDPDMLEVGNGGMTATEYRAHFSLCAILAAPLIAGNDLRNMTPETREILTNKEVIGVDQDALGRQGRRVWKGGLPATGAIARTATNIRSGAQSPVAGMVHAATLWRSGNLVEGDAEWEPRGGVAESWISDTDDHGELGTDRLSGTLKCGRAGFVGA
jgi:alpha-galactosidase